MNGGHTKRMAAIWRHLFAYSRPAAVRHLLVPAVGSEPAADVRVDFDLLTFGHEQTVTISPDRTLAELPQLGACGTNDFGTRPKPLPRC